MEVDYLTEDSNLPKNQKYLSLSLLYNNDKTKLNAVKVRGIYNDLKVATEDAKKIRNLDEYFDVFVGECGKWLSVNTKQDTTTYDTLNLSMKQYMESHENNKFVHEQRKNTMMIKNLDDNISSRLKTIEELKTNKLSDEELLQRIEPIEEQILKLTNKKKELNEQNDLLKSKIRSEYSNEESKTLSIVDEVKNDKVIVNNDEVPSEYKYLCLSFFADDNNKMYAIKMRGAFETEEQANEQGKYLQSVDEYFHVFVGDTGKWLQFNPSLESVAKSEYGNEQLNNLMKGYNENQEKAKLFHEQKKHEDLRAKLLDNIDKKKDTLKSNKGLSLAEIEEQIKEMEAEKQKLDDTINNLVTQITPSGLDLSQPKIIQMDE